MQRASSVLRWPRRRMIAVIYPWCIMAGLDEGAGLQHHRQAPWSSKPPDRQRTTWRSPIVDGLLARRSQLISCTACVAWASYRCLFTARIPLHHCPTSHATHALHAARLAHRCASAPPPPTLSPLPSSIISYSYLDCIWRDLDPCGPSRRAWQRAPHGRGCSLGMLRMGACRLAADLAAVLQPLDGSTCQLAGRAADGGDDVTERAGERGATSPSLAA